MFPLFHIYILLYKSLSCLN